MKKKRFLAVLCATLFCTSFFLASCHKEEGNMPPLDEVVTPPQEEPEIPPEEDDEKYKTLSLNYFNYLMIDTCTII